jgi:hypothetical protein
MMRPIQNEQNRILHGSLGELLIKHATSSRRDSAELLHEKAERRFIRNEI